MPIARFRNARSSNEGTVAAQHERKGAPKTNHRAEVTAAIGQGRWTRRQGRRSFHREDAWFGSQAWASARPEHCRAVARTVRQRESDSICPSWPNFHRATQPASADAPHHQPAVEPRKNFAHTSCPGQSDKQPLASHRRRFWPESFRPPGLERPRSLCEPKPCATGISAPCSATAAPPAANGSWPTKGVQVCRGSPS